MLEIDSSKLLNFSRVSLPRLPAVRTHVAEKWDKT